jgi:hypothetical protein
MEPGLRVSLLFPAAERALLHASRLSLPSSSIPRVPVTPPASYPEGRQMS